MTLLENALAQRGEPRGIEASRPLSVRGQLEARANKLKEVSDLAQEALDLLDKNPDLERLLNIMREVGVY